MADSFRKRIAIEVDLLTGKLKQGMTDFRTSVAQASGPMGKFQAGVSSLGGTMRSLPFTAVAGGAAVAGAAVAKFAVDSVNSYADMSVRAADFSDQVGLSVEQGSKFIGVTDRMGLRAESLVNAVDRFNSIMVETPEVFDQYGVAVERADDGSADMIGTLANVADEMVELGQGAEAATLANSLLGARWQELAPLLFQGGDAIRTAMEDVKDFEIVNEEAAEQGREWQAATVELSKSLDSFSQSAGQVLLPTFLRIVETGSDVISTFREIGAAIPDLDFEVLGLGMNELEQAADDAGASLGDAFIGGLAAASNWHSFWTSSGDDDTDSIANQAAAAEGLDQKLHNAAASMREQAEAARDAGRENQAAQFDLTAEKMTELAEAAEAAKEESSELADEARDLADAMEGLGDSSLDVEAAQDDWAQTLADLDQALADATEGTNDQAEADRNVRQVIRDATQAAVDQAGALRDNAVAQAEASGETLSAIEALDIWNGSMLDAAATADGPLRQSILDYVAEVNQIPPDKVTEIEAAVAAGDLATAQQLLDDASAQRQAEIEAVAHTRAAEEDLDFLSRRRTIELIAIMKGTVPVEGGSLHLTDLETGQEEGVIPDEHTLELRFEADPSDVLAGWDAARQRIEDAEEAAREAEEEFTPAIDRLRSNLDDLRTVFDLEGMTRDEYLAHLLQHLAGYDEWSLEWVAIRERIVAVEKEAVAEQEAALREEERIQQEAQRNREKEQRAREKDLEERRRYVEGIRETFGGAEDLVSQFAGEEDVTIGDLLGASGEQAREGKAFRSAIAGLRQKGDLPEGLILALLDAGPEALEIVRALNRATPEQRRLLAGRIASIARSSGLTAEAAARMVFPGLAGGGTSAGGLTLVGERGVELVDLPGGSRVSHADETRRLLAQQPRGDTYHIEMNVRQAMTPDETIRQLRRWTRRNGEIRVA